ncbi:hypothetical protein CDAR_176891 [Caerostris darwini]|uniref:Uncharacterized protein n=1 Tax=Caerostris darwini TaxID=1538125 RepID=A0AAV4RJD4_9ARAC|nr:hypothetical protein CDAR_176891 [Caerostris darwini]
MCINCKQVGHTAAWRQCPKYPTACTPPQNPINSKNVHFTQVNPNFSYANTLSTNLTLPQPNLAPSLLQGTPRPSPAPVSTIGNHHNENNLNINNDNTNKVLYILNVFINIFNSLGSVENIYNKFQLTKSCWLLVPPGSHMEN